MKNNHKTLKVCHGNNCGFFGENIHDRLIADTEKNPVKKTVIEKCPCRGFCSEGPIIVEEHNGKTTIHKRMDPIRASKLL